MGVREAMCVHAVPQGRAKTSSRGVRDAGTGGPPAAAAAVAAGPGPWPRPVSGGCTYYFCRRGVTISTGPHTAAADHPLFPVWLLLRLQRRRPPMRMCRIPLTEG